MIAARRLGVIHVFIVWISSITRQNYPTRFKIEIPSLEAKFEVVCTPKEQEFVSK